MAKPQRITLNGIQRRGLVNWRGREEWLQRQVSIWSREHSAWWRPDGHGYTSDGAQAWVLPFADAYDTTKHCGPEKKIVYYAMPEPAEHIFTCLRCEMNLTVEAPTDECPVCSWKRVS